MGGDDAAFAGSIPDVYEQLLVPMIFAEPAALLADTIGSLAPQDVLETAAGTGVLTRAVRRRVPHAAIVATDLNEPMLRHAAAVGLPGVEWRTADAQDLPFPDASFDLVACQFGAMFFPDKGRAYAEVARVLRSGGRFAFSVWDRIEANVVADAVTQALVAADPEHPLLFMSRVPHGYFDPDALRDHLAAAGLMIDDLRVVDGVSRTTAHEAAVAFCQGTPVRAHLEKHPVLDVETATAAAEQALTDRFGTGVLEAPIRWLQVVAATR